MSELERWEARFAAADYVFGTEPNAFLRRQKPLLPPGGHALAVADGEGRNGVWLAEQGLKVTSVDFSSQGQAKASKLAAQRGVSLDLQRADLAEWIWPKETFDVVAAIFIQFASPTFRQRVFDGIRCAMKPNGLLLLEGYRPEQLAYKTGGPSQVENLYTREILRDSFKDWTVIELREHDSIIEEGGGHGGMSALIDLVARKPRAEAASLPQLANARQTIG